MSNMMRNNFIISTVGLGVAIGALAPVVGFPTVVLFAVGLGMVIGGVFRALNQVQYRLKQMAGSD